MRYYGVGGGEEAEGCVELWEGAAVAGEAEDHAGLPDWVVVGGGGDEAGVVSICEIAFQGW